MPKSLCLVLKTKWCKQILILKNNPEHFYGQGKVLNSVLMKGLWWWWFSHEVVSNSLHPMDYNPTGFSVHGVS